MPSTHDSSGVPGAVDLPFHAWAPTPPMGWNSWDAFGTTVTEAEVRAQAETMAAEFRRYGWQYIVVDIQWYEPGATGYGYRAGVPLTLDAWGRLSPAPNRFPSAAGGQGFRPLGDFVHGLGLKLGLHLMRGIPRLAVTKNLPILGTPHHAADIADRTSVCPWNPDMFGVDMAKPGAQAYYDAVFELLASWGVDYVKLDDMSRPYHDHEPEIAAVRRAIDRTGRAMVLSLSPGETALTAAEHVRRHANLWRISDDFWDNWDALREQFARLVQWNVHRGTGYWPDADMLPLGVLDRGRRTTRLTKDEQFTLMTLWSITRSPLMHGGDLTRTDELTRGLLTNPEVLAVNQQSSGNRPLFDRDGLMAWAADVPASPDRYLAVFNARDLIPLSPERADARVEVTSSERGAEVAPAEIDLDVTGAEKLLLWVDDGGPNRAHDFAVWGAPRVVLGEGREHPLTPSDWTKASGWWGNQPSERAPSGEPLSVGGRVFHHGLGAHTKSLIEFDLPQGSRRFRASCGFEDSSLRAPDARLRFLVFAPERTTMAETPGLAIPIQAEELELYAPVRVRDLWTHEDLGEFQGRFAPMVAWHGARLFRVSPLASNARTSSGIG
jgi:alpha-galactosidase